jgi:hypothetical protein
LEIDAKTIHEELTTALGPNAPSYRTVARWASRFREGREDVNDDPRSGRPVFELTDENIELVRQVINNDPHSTYDDIIAETCKRKSSTVEFISSNKKKKQSFFLIYLDLFFILFLFFKVVKYEYHIFVYDPKEIVSFNIISIF